MKHFSTNLIQIVHTHKKKSTTIPDNFSLSSTRDEAAWQRSRCLFSAPRARCAVVFPAEGDLLLLLKSPSLSDTARLDGALNNSLGRFNSSAAGGGWRIIEPLPLIRLRGRTGWWSACVCACVRGGDVCIIPQIRLTFLCRLKCFYAFRSGSPCWPAHSVWVMSRISSGPFSQLPWVLREIAPGCTGVYCMSAPACENVEDVSVPARTETAILHEITAVQHLFQHVIILYIRINACLDLSGSTQRSTWFHESSPRLLLLHKVWSNR